MLRVFPAWSFPHAKLCYGGKKKTKNRTKQCIVPLHKIQQKKMQNTCLVLGVRIEVGLGARERGPAQQQEGGFWEC